MEDSVFEIVLILGIILFIVDVFIYFKVFKNISKMKTAIAEILFKEGYIKSFELISNENQGIIRITLKYDEKGTRIIDGIKRISKPGLRVYAGKEELPRVLNGLGIAIISTSKGLKTDKEAREAGMGGEVLAYIW